ncbi:MAG: IS630 family transposase [Desulfobulbus sp.]|nr:IS630 family transposase [Desulfobulbus sp.]
MLVARVIEPGSNLAARRALHQNTAASSLGRVLDWLYQAQPHLEQNLATDPEFSAKSADIIGLYLNPPENAIVLSVDEKPGMQALARTTGVVQLSDGKCVSAMKSAYKRNGTLNLFAALEIAAGAVYGKTAQTKKKPDFLAFLDDVLLGVPGSPEAEHHVILDNYCTHKKCGEWLSAHPGVFFHYTPTSANWLNQVEIWFGIFSRKVMRGASFNSAAQLAEAIASFIKAYNQHSKPFVWKKRQVRGSQMANKLSNLCV